LSIQGENILDKAIVKICKVCGPLIDEQATREKKSSYRGCKKCISDKNKAKRLADPERFKELRRKSRILERDPDVETIFCVRCKIDKKVLEFNASMLNMRSPYCRECSRASVKAHHDKEESKNKHREWYNRQYRDKARHLNYQKHYGISLDDYNEMLLKQNGVCAICKKHQIKSARNHDNYLSVDHCHSTGKIRGLLCNKCNQGLGLFGDSVESLLIAIQYLQSY
jgi:hypothetical protein